MDSFRSVGIKVPYSGNGPFWALKDGRKMLAPFGRLGQKSLRVCGQGSILLLGFQIAVSSFVSIFRQNKLSCCRMLPAPNRSKANHCPSGFFLPRERVFVTWQIHPPQAEPLLRFPHAQFKMAPSVCRQIAGATPAASWPWRLSTHSIMTVLSRFYPSRKQHLIQTLGMQQAALCQYPLSLLARGSRSAQ